MCTYFQYYLKKRCVRASFFFTLNLVYNSATLELVWYIFYLHLHLESLYSNNSQELPFKFACDIQIGHLNFNFHNYFNLFFLLLSIFTMLLQTFQLLSSTFEERCTIKNGSSVAPTIGFIKCVTHYLKHTLVSVSKSESLLIVIEMFG